MPTYAYRCTGCGHRLEVKQSFTDDALTVCPECGGQLRKQFSPVGVVFKGSGFYRTDSRSSGHSSAGASSPSTTSTTSTATTPTTSSSTAEAAAS